MKEECRAYGCYGIMVKK